MGAGKGLRHGSGDLYGFGAGRALDAPDPDLGPLVPAAVMADVGSGLDPLVAERAPSAGRRLAGGEAGGYIGHLPYEPPDDAQNDQGGDQVPQYGPPGVGERQHRQQPFYLVVSATDAELSLRRGE